MREIVNFIRNCRGHLPVFIIDQILSLEWKSLVYLKLKPRYQNLRQYCGFHQGLFFAVSATKAAIIYVHVYRPSWDYSTAGAWGLFVRGRFSCATLFFGVQ